MKRKISVTTGTRAEYGILREILNQIKNSRHLELYLIVTGMHLDKKYGKTINEIKKDGFVIYSSFGMLSKNDSNYFMAKNLGVGIDKFARIFNKLKPDINIIFGDRDESLASALAAYHLNIPNAHIHGGDKTKAGIDEYNRHVITKSSNIHFAATKKSFNRILKMGENPKYVFLTGSPSIDEIFKNKILTKRQLEKKYKIQFTGKEVLLLQHPVTTQSKLSKIQISNTLNALSKIKNQTIAIMPNSDSGNKAIFKQLSNFEKKYHFIKTFRTLPREDYLGMLKNCGVLVGNSSSGIIEASCFNIPVVNIGIRQQDREKGENIFDVPNATVNSILRAIKNALESSKRQRIKGTIYGDGNASKKIVKQLERIKINDELIQKQIFY